jgi:hypothetical protein
MEAVSISEMSVKTYRTTRRNIPEDSHPQLKNFSLEASRIFLLKSVVVPLFMLQASRKTIWFKKFR